MAAETPAPSPTARRHAAVARLVRVLRAETAAAVARAEAAEATLGQIATLAKPPAGG